MHIMKFGRCLRLSAHKKRGVDDFIIRHSKNNAKNDLFLDQHALDQRRLVFIGVKGPYRSWAQCPSVMLYSALFLIPLKRQWIMNPMKYKEKLQSAFDEEHISEAQDFIDLLLWKDSQGLVFWMLDDYELPEQQEANLTIDPLIDPLWYHLSAKLSQLYDPISGKTHNPLILDSRHYQKQFVSKYGVNAVGVLSELYFLTKKEDVIKEIVYQSNEKSIVPVSDYRNTTMYDLYTINE